MSFCQTRNAGSYKLNTNTISEDFLVIERFYYAYNIASLDPKEIAVGNYGALYEWDDEAMGMTMLESDLLGLAAQGCKFAELAEIHSRELRAENGWFYQHYYGNIHSLPIEETISDLLAKGWLVAMTADHAKAFREDHVRIFGHCSNSTERWEGDALLTEKGVDMHFSQGENDRGPPPSIEWRENLEIITRPKKFTVDDLPVEYHSIEGRTVGGEEMGIVKEISPLSDCYWQYLKGWRLIAPYNKDRDYWDCLKDDPRNVWGN